MTFNKSSLNISKTRHIKHYTTIACILFMTTISLAQTLPDKKRKKITTEEKEIEKHKHVMTAVNKKDAEVYLHAWNAMSLTKYLKARKLFEQLAKKGLAFGQHELGIMYKNGFGVTRDLKKRFTGMKKQRYRVSKRLCFTFKKCTPKEINQYVTLKKLNTGARN